MARDEPQLPTPSLPSAARTQGIRPILLALALGTAGGTVFFVLALPLPWMLGAMAATTAASLAGWDVRVPRGMRNAMITVLGVMLGSAFTPDILSRINEWGLTLSALATWMLLVGTAAVFYFRRFAGYDRVTAYFSGMPGGLNEMVMVGNAMGGDERVIALTHAARIMLVVFAIPFWYRFTGIDAGAAQPSVGLLDIAALDYLVLSLCAPLGVAAARIVRLPAAFLIGPMAVSAAVHLAGITASKPPTLLVGIAQIVVGSMIGCRFVGAPLALVRRVVTHAVASAVMMMAAAVAVAAVLASWTGYTVPALVLAFAPGGLAEMSLVALALGVDTAFVACHHIARISMVVTFAPAVFRLTRRT